VDYTQRDAIAKEIVNLLRSSSENLDNKLVNAEIAASNAAGECEWGVATC
jgi:hypothetical protein